MAKVSKESLQLLRPEDDLHSFMLQKYRFEYLASEIEINGANVWGLISSGEVKNLFFFQNVRL